MSFERQRAIEVRAESTFRALRPAAARALFVSWTRRASSVDEKLLADQANTRPGAANVTTMATSAARDFRGRRRGSGAVVRSGFAIVMAQILLRNFGRPSSLHRPV